MQRVTSDFEFETRFKDFCEAPVSERVKDLEVEVSAYEDALTYQNWLVRHLTDQYCPQFVSYAEQERQTLGKRRIELNKQL